MFRKERDDSSLEEYAWLHGEVLAIVSGLREVHEVIMQGESENDSARYRNAMESLDRIGLLAIDRANKVKRAIRKCTDRPINNRLAAWSGYLRNLIETVVIIELSGGGTGNWHLLEEVPPPIVD